MEKESHFSFAFNHLYNAHKNICIENYFRFYASHQCADQLYGEYIKRTHNLNPIQFNPTITVIMLLYTVQLSEHTCGTHVYAMIRTFRTVQQ